MEALVLQFIFESCGAKCLSFGNSCLTGITVESCSGFEGKGTVDKNSTAKSLGKFLLLKSSD